MTLLSIIIPVYNDKDHIDYCLKSVLNQSITDYEVICVDDCSSDISYDKVRWYALNDSRVKPYQMKKNSGSGACRNLGLDVAQGEYIAFLDSDDYFPDDKSLEKLLDIAQEYNASLVRGNIQFEEYIEDEKNYKIHYGNGRFPQTDELKIYKSDAYGMPWYFYRNIFKKELFTDKNIRFPNLKRGQDTAFLANILNNIDYFVHVPVTSYAYRIPLENKLTTFDKFLAYSKSFYETLIYLKEDQFDKLIDDVINEFIKLEKREIPIEINNEEQLNKFNEMLNELDEYCKNTYSEKRYNKIKNSIDNLSKKAYETHKYAVSVIIPVYNVERYLTLCLNSIINQTLDRIEIICVEDCSPDSSKEIIKYFVEKDERVKLIENKENKGLGASRNVGLAHATGEYVIFIDSDDWLDKNTLKTLYDYSKENKLDVLMYKLINYDDLENKYYTQEYYDLNQLDKFKNKIFTYKDVPAADIFKLAVCAVNKLYSRNFLENINAKFPENIIHEDNPFFYHVFFEAKRMGIVDNHFYNRLRRQGSITTNDGPFVLGSVDISYQILEVFLNNGFYPEYKSSVLNYIVNFFRYRYDVINEKYRHTYYKKEKEFFYKLINEHELEKDLEDNLNKINKQYMKNILITENHDEFLKIINNK
ncbi:glycosyltransferase family 2 protein [Methanosphaera sp. WGK6]|uniref:glycosyltransferase family 2 protein n=1 Tax=Methanosphaera sp. WGK6 TaxID=1561964 RepID=UPI00084C4497|nr:glycosyltransferase family 2 protein [Methanosphaera sp. WGK6]